MSAKIQTNLQKLIYIPIWIDLKDNEFEMTAKRFGNLHSNMDRFERQVGQFLRISLSNLHSNMDRFERNNIFLILIHCLMYLHSNMDRFERNRDYITAGAYYIYIPIWIDLKAVPTSTVKPVASIYIPIWIDLKERNDYSD